MKDVKIMKNVVYASTEREHLTADIYLPIGVKDTPVVFLVHGGAFQAGSKEMYADWGPHLATNGIAAIAINYRLATPKYASYPGVIEDMREAVNFAVLHANEWDIDPYKMGFIGDSAGAYLGSMMAFDDNYSSFKIKLVISVYAVLDIIDWAEYTNATRTDDVITKMFGKDIFTGKNLYEEASPMLKIDEAIRDPMFTTKFMMIWGGEDDIVLPENQTLAFIEKLKKYQIPYTTVTVPDKGHFWFTKNVADDAVNSLKNYPLSIVEPKVMEFLQSVFYSNAVSDPTDIAD